MEVEHFALENLPKGSRIVFQSVPLFFKGELLNFGEPPPMPPQTPSN